MDRPAKRRRVLHVSAPDWQFFGSPADMISNTITVHTDPETACSIPSQHDEALHAAQLRDCPQTGQVDWASRIPTSSRRISNARNVLLNAVAGVIEDGEAVVKRTKAQEEQDRRESILEDADQAISRARARLLQPDTKQASIQGDHGQDIRAVVERIKVTAGAKLGQFRTIAGHAPISNIELARKTFVGDSSAFSCSFCKSRFNDFDTFYQHLELLGHHAHFLNQTTKTSIAQGNSPTDPVDLTSSSSFKCNICKQTFPSYPRLSHHIDKTSHHYPPLRTDNLTLKNARFYSQPEYPHDPVICIICQRSFLNYRDCEFHMERVGHLPPPGVTPQEPTPVKPYHCHCSICKRGFYSDWDLLDHMDEADHHPPDVPGEPTLTGDKDKGGRRAEGIESFLFRKLRAQGIGFGDGLLGRDAS